MLAASYDFNAIIEISNGSTVSASARQMLQSGNFTYWTSGPVATTIILADHGASRAYDLGFDSNRSFRPIFQAVFWPSINKVHVRFVGEVSNSQFLQDMSYALALRLGNSSPASVYSNASVTHHAASRWTKDYWINGSPASVKINHNLQHLIQTRFVPNFDTSLSMPNSKVQDEYEAWLSRDRDLFGAGNWQKAMGAAGARPDIGPYPDWVVRWLFTFDNRMLEKVRGNADLAAAWPMHLREGNGAKSLDRSKAVSGIGRILSISTRPSIFLYQGLETAASYTYTRPEDRPVLVGSISNDGWRPDGAHQPDPFSVLYMLTGDYFYLEELLFWASFSAARYNGAATTGHYGRGPTGTEGGIQDEVRGDGWVLRSRAQTAHLTPDDMPEKAYFSALVEDALALWEGQRGITGTRLSNNPNWQWGATVGIGRWSRVAGNQIPPLHFWENNTGATQQVDTSVTKGATSPWMQNYLIYGLGRAKELGFPTDALLTWVGENLVNQLTNPSFNPWLAGAYRTPVMKVDDTYFTTWAEVLTGYNAEDRALTTWPSSAYPSLYDGYTFVARTATAMVYHLPNGEAAWNKVEYQVGSNVSILNSEPKFGIIPRLDGLDNTLAPSAPTNLQIIKK
jgi:hypothetical protein